MATNIIELKQSIRISHTIYKSTTLTSKSIQIDYEKQRVYFRLCGPGSLYYLDPMVGFNKFNDWEKLYPSGVEYKNCGNYGIGEYLIKLVHLDEVYNLLKQHNPDIIY